MSKETISDDYTESIKEIYNLDPQDSQSIRSYLKFIVEKISAGAMCALVGSGFSKNANDKFPSWNELFIKAYKDMKEEAKTEDNEVIKKKISKEGETIFAEKYEQFKRRREFLDCYIEDILGKINNDKNNNLELHCELLNINWSDIITTNWDTLLEEANNKLNKKYQVVCSSKKLKNANRNRIIKIHGTLRTEEEKSRYEYGFDGCSEHLYIVTESDFKNYSIQHESFSNFMKVKILENSFCLFGFSGDDPNFRYWIKELKRTMTKGGATELPNPIFLIDKNDKEPDNVTMQFYKNNYIIRISISDIKKNIETKNKENDLFLPIFKENNQTNNNIKNEYLILLKWLLKKTKQSNYFNTLQSKKIESWNKTLQNIAFSRTDDVVENLINKYNEIPLFFYSNLFYEPYLISSLNKLALKIEQWSEKTFDFVYRLCMGNFYSLSNIYKQDVIEKIIEKFKYTYLNNNKDNTIYFSELVFKYYRENDKQDEMKNLYEKLSYNANVKNIYMYQLALSYCDKFDYEKLEDFLEKEWLPEKEKNILYIMRKISLLLSFDNVYTMDDRKKDKIIKLFNLVIKNINKKEEQQLAYFACLFFLYYKNSIFCDEKKEIQNLIYYFEKDFFLPQKFIDSIFEESKTNSIKPNDSKRYSRILFSFNNSKNDIFKLIQCLNFLEYTGLPLNKILDEKRFLELIKLGKDSDAYFITKILLHSLPYCGRSSDEDFLCAIAPKILRYLPNKSLNILFEQVFSIFKYKITNKQNAKIYIFLLSEILKRASRDKQKKFIGYLSKKIELHHEEVIFPIQQGDMWGWGKPFLYFIQLIKDKDAFKQILLWVMKQYIKEPENIKRYNSNFLQYYKKMLFSVKKFVPEKKYWFNNDSNFKELINSDMEQTKQLALYAYNFLNKDIKKILRDYLEQNYTMQTNPYFIRLIKTKALKERCINIILKHDVMDTSSINFPIISIMKALSHTKLLRLDDKKLLVANIMEKYEYLIDKKKKLNMLEKFDDKIENLFFVVATITNEKERRDNPDLQIAYDTLKEKYMEEKSDLIKFDWLYNSDFYTFRINFLDCISYFSYLKIARENIAIFNLVISRIIVCDSEDFEAVLEYIIIIYKNKYENDVLNNDITAALLLQLLTKFKHDIPLCYDDLFIKEQMKKLANELQKNNIKSPSIDYWL